MKYVLERSTFPLRQSSDCVAINAQYAAPFSLAPRFAIDLDEIMALWLGCQRSFISPSSSDAIHNGCRWNASAFAPLSRAQCYAVVCEQDVTRVVAALLLKGGPSAVLWAIVAVLINAVDGMLGRRATAHVGQKVVERLPSVADTNASETVVLGVSLVCSAASLSHVFPAQVLWAFVALASLAMGDGVWFFTLSAPATGGYPVSEVGAHDLPNCSAVTATKPAIAMNMLHHGPSSKPLSSQIDSFWHAKSYQQMSGSQIENPMQM